MLALPNSVRELYASNVASDRHTLSTMYISMRIHQMLAGTIFAVACNDAAVQLVIVDKMASIREAVL